MKLRFTRTALRIRLKRKECEQLKIENSVIEPLHWLHSRYEAKLSLHANDNAIVDFSTNLLHVSIPTSKANFLFNDEVGVKFVLSQNGASFVLLIEKDFKCLHPRSFDEDTEDIDTFTHPLSKSK